MPLQQMEFPVNTGKIDQSPTYQTSLGAAFLGDSLRLLEELPDNSINLVFTSPPFALQREKAYITLEFRSIFVMKSAFS
jgi:hypothetical protein